MLSIPQSLSHLVSIQSRVDCSLFTKSPPTGLTAILVYVDDLVVAGNDLDEIIGIKRLLDDRFKIKDIGNLKYFLAMEVAQSKARNTLYHRKYTLDLLQDCWMIGAKLVSTPMDYTLKLSKIQARLCQIPLNIKDWWVGFSTWPILAQIFPLLWED